MRKLTLALCALLLIPVVGMAQKVGVIDFQGATLGSNAGLDAQEQIQARFNEFNADLAVTEAELSAAQTRYETQQRALSATALSQLEATIARLQTRLAREQEDASLELDVIQAELLQPISDRIQEIVIEYADQEGYTLVLDASAGVVFASEAANITPAIVRIMNESPATSGGDSEPAPAAEPPAEPEE